MKIHARAMRTAMRAASLALALGRVVKIIDNPARRRRVDSPFNAPPSSGRAFVWSLLGANLRMLCVDDLATIKRTERAEQLRDQDREVTRARYGLLNRERLARQPGVDANRLFGREPRSAGKLIPNRQSESEVDVLTT